MVYVTEMASKNMKYKKGKPHLKNSRKEVSWGSPKKYQLSRKFRQKIKEEI